MALKSQKANPNISFPSIRSNASNGSTKSTPTSLDFRSRLIHQIIPCLFFAALLIAGTIVCIYSLFLVQVVPAHALLGCVITMAILFSAEIIFCLCIRSDRKTTGTSDAESQQDTQPNRQSWTSFTRRPREQQLIQSSAKDELAIMTGRGNSVVPEDFGLSSRRTPKEIWPEQSNGERKAHGDCRKKEALPKHDRWDHASAPNMAKVRAVQSNDRLFFLSNASQPSLALASDILEIANVVPEHPKQSPKVDIFHPRRGSYPLSDSKLDLEHNTRLEQVVLNRIGGGTLPEIRPLSVRKIKRNRKGDWKGTTDPHISGAIGNDTPARENHETRDNQRSGQAS